MPVVALTIDRQRVEVEQGTSILEAARRANVKIPTLCYLKDINVVGECGVCLVEIEGADSLKSACVTPVEEGMRVFTYSPAVREARRKAVEAIRDEVVSTYRPEVLSELGGFSALFAGRFEGMKDPVLVSSVDGVGTKVMVAQMLDRHDTIGVDLVAMCVDDIVTCGA
ncbi:MAG: 2Fe-2S iron-sulfur cluster-binding protein, partial [Syntrophomonadaceae bacterium]|nr:2Fe-2S iron-sulfur cluster-binding protein [Syntrophomonadaceae bacterium]